MNFEGVRYDGAKEPESGTGFLIGQSLVLTANHVIPRLADYETTTISVVLPNQPGSFTAQLVKRDPTHDLAVIRLDQAPVVPRPPCPIEGVTAIKSVPLGSGLSVLSYPLGLPVGPTSGVLGGQGFEGRWRMDSPLDPGASGAPVFLSDDGTLLGVAVGGVRWTERGGRYLPVLSINSFEPLTAIADGPLKDLVEQDSQCWQVAAAPTLEIEEVAFFAPRRAGLLRRAGAVVGELLGATKAFAFSKSQASPKAEPPPMDLMTYATVQSPAPATPPVERRAADVLLKAEPGYEILRCLPRERGALAQTNVSCKIDPQGSTAVFHYELEVLKEGSGFWDGLVVLQQRRLDGKP